MLPVIILRRVLRQYGHEVKLIPPQYVKPYVKTNKTDAADAEAICEAVARPNMRFVQIKTDRATSYSGAAYRAKHPYPRTHCLC
ncbi:transposase family protein [Yersinia enterocolitica]|nr:transposase family protein [Yersinia enterocolitica]